MCEIKIFRKKVFLQTFLKNIFLALFIFLFCSYYNLEEHCKKMEEIFNSIEETRKALEMMHHPQVFIDFHFISF